MFRQRDRSRAPISPARAGSIANDRFRAQKVARSELRWGAAMTEVGLPGTERVSTFERIASLDVLRGVAILFILFMNIPGMGNYAFIVHDPRIPSWTNADSWSWWVQMTFMDGTQRGLLELLFGAGILIMARKAMEPDGPVAVADLHYRRNLYLCAFGLFNAFVLMWYGDILVTYGLAAVFLFPFRTMKPKWLLAIGGAFLTVLLIYSYSGYREDVGNKATYERVAAATASLGALPALRAVATTPVPSGLVRTTASPTRAPALVSIRDGSTSPVTA